ncbi:di-trans,poly-cis-decaprenylcistransferase [Candidatus Berkelbacteria bacterium]|nr:di-trans,poly-cis-decaprenylcistransferase [Candidatus Berkelbacteria bacterium]
MALTMPGAPLPTHIGLILDGNRRWATEQGKPAAVGHAAGADNLDATIDRFLARGIPYLTVYAFSTENWKRSAIEVEFLLTLIERRLRERADHWQSRGVVIRQMGQFDRLPASLQRLLSELTAPSETPARLTLTFCLSYGGRDELRRAIQRLIERGVGRAELTEEIVAGALDSAGLPDPDLIIRTSGEQRLSGFLTWQSVYSELYFAPCHWPDFDEAALDAALTWYAERQRRYGK